jgi:hypothetical protein
MHIYKYIYLKSIIIDMKKLFYSLLLFTFFIVLLSSCRKPIACIDVYETPTKNVKTSINGFCSERAKFYVYEIDGVTVWSDNTSNFDFTFTTLGQHIIKLTTFRRFEGTYDSRTGCNGCKGSGKSSSISKIVTVIN